MTRLVSSVCHASLPPWLPPALVVAMALVVPLAFLWPAASEFPMDDAYIHFVYAGNLAEDGRLAFNGPGEKGVGTTSLVWVLLLAGGRAFGLSMHVLARLLGIVSLATVGLGIYALMRPILSPLPALIGALLVTVSGNMAWFALSGMETVLFVALGILAMLAYRQARWGWLGLLLGLLALTRPEGIALAMAIGVVELWRSRRIGRGLLVAAVICALVCGPWFGYLLWRTGHVIPTSAVGKQLSSTVGIRLIVERNPALAWLAHVPGVVYPALWLVYVLEFVLGGMAFPAPHLPIGAVVDNEHYTLSVWAVIGWVGVVAPLLWMAARRVGPRRWAAWAADDRRRPLLVFLAWLALHNLTYMLFLPIPGTASRYGAINHVALWLALTAGLFAFVRRPRLWSWLAVGLGTIAVVNTVYWAGVYDANLDHMQQVRIAAARFLRDHLSDDEQYAAFDIGALRYYGQRPLVDLGGLVDPDAERWFLDGAVDRYLVEHGADYLVLPGRAGTTEEGWFDFAAVMGLTQSSLLRLEPVAAFEIDDERWLQGYLPTGNYQASAAIYRLVRSDKSSRAALTTKDESGNH